MKFYTLTSVVSTREHGIEMHLSADEFFLLQIALAELAFNEKTCEARQEEAKRLLRRLYNEKEETIKTDS